MSSYSAYHDHVAGAGDHDDHQAGGEEQGEGAPVLAVRRLRQLGHRRPHRPHYRPWRRLQSPIQIVLFPRHLLSQVDLDSSGDEKGVVPTPSLSQF